MRRQLIWLLVTLVGALGLVANGAWVASAAACPPGTVPSSDAGATVICIPVVDPGTPPKVHEPGMADTGSGPGTCTKQGETIPCVTERGIWMSSKQCYANVATPQPPATNPAWAGNSPDEGQLWSCATGPNTISAYFFVPDGATPALIDPGELAQNALGVMPLAQAIARIAPTPEFHTYVHLDNWLWLPESQWTTLRKTVTAGGTSVTVTAEPIRVEWDMGSDTVTCSDAGRAWRKGMTDAAKTPCSYAYETLEDPRGDTHDVSARIVYQADWTCSGACLSGSGTLGEVSPPPGETTTIEVRQRQTVVVR